MFLPLQGGGQEGDGVSVGVVLNLPKRKINSTIRISAIAGLETERSIISNGVNKVAPAFESERYCILNPMNLSKLQ
jgi:hypothetical protein